jgi:hypothetical protein
LRFWFRRVSVRTSGHRRCQDAAPVRTHLLRPVLSQCNKRTRRARVTRGPLPRRACAHPRNIRTVTLPRHNRQEHARHARLTPSLNACHEVSTSLRRPYGDSRRRPATATGAGDKPLSTSHRVIATHAPLDLLLKHLVETLATYD